MHALPSTIAGRTWGRYFWNGAPNEFGRYCTVQGREKKRTEEKRIKEKRRGEERRGEEKRREEKRRKTHSQKERERCIEGHKNVRY